VTGAVEPPADGLPGDLASAHAVILAQRELLAAAQSEAKARVLEIERLKLELARARRGRFGQSSERGKLLVEQLELMIEDLEETQAEEEAKAEIASPETAKAPRRRPQRGPRKLPENLPVERVVEQPPCVCGKCGGDRLRKLGEVVSKTLECEPRRWKIVERVREKFACRDCEAVTEPPAPSHAIPRGFAGPSLLAMILVGKFGDHLPLNRQSAAFAREGVELDCSTLADWVGGCAAALDPILSEIRRHALAAERLHMDDTTAPALAKIKARTGRLWTYVRDDRPFGGQGPPAVLFDYTLRAMANIRAGFSLAGRASCRPTPTRATMRSTPKTESPRRSSRRRAGRTGGGTFSRSPGFTKAPIAAEIVRRIDESFAIERAISGKPPDERRAARQERSKPSSPRSKPICASSCGGCRPRTRSASRSAICCRAGRPSPASSTTEEFACRTTPQNGLCAAWLSGAATGPSPALTKGAVAPRRSTRWFKPAASTTSIRRPGSQMSSHDSPIIPQSASAN